MARLKATRARPADSCDRDQAESGRKAGCRRAPAQAKISREIAEIRGIPRDRDCVSPAAHSAFRNADGLLDFVESIASETGSARRHQVGRRRIEFWEDLARLMAAAPAVSTSSRSTAAKAVPGPARWSSRITWPCPSRWGSAGFRRSSRRTGCTNGWYSSDRENSASRNRRSSPSPGLRLRQRRTRSDAGDRLHPGTAVPHQPLPDRSRDAEPMACAGLDPDAEAGRLANYVVTLSKDLLALEPGMRRAASGTHQRRSARDARWPFRIQDGRRGVRI